MLAQSQRHLALSWAASSLFRNVSPAATGRISCTNSKRSQFARALKTNSEVSSSHGDWSSSSQGESIFSPSSSWDQIFRNDEHSSTIPKSSSPEPTASRLVRRQTMTERETKVISGMLDMIFDKQKLGGVVENKSKAQAGVGGGHIDDLVGRLRRHTRPLRWARGPSSDLLDQKKEQMSHCKSDQELLAWAQREVFDESKRYEETAKRIMEEASSGSGPGAELPMLQSPVYPQILAHLMRTFRVNYKDPNLALFIFHHAQKLSVVSYVFGCSTEAYNELIETRWSCFRDLQGAYKAVEEMVLNGVAIDSRTRKIVEGMRRDIVGVDMPLGLSEDGQQALWATLSKIEQSVAAQAPETAAQPRKAWDSWKTEILKDDNTDGWAFDDWYSLPRRATSTQDSN